MHLSGCGRRNGGTVTVVGGNMLGWALVGVWKELVGHCSLWLICGEQCVARVSSLGQGVGFSMALFCEKCHSGLQTLTAVHIYDLIKVEGVCILGIFMELKQVPPLVIRHFKTCRSPLPFSLQDKEIK